MKDAEKELLRKKLEELISKTSKELIEMENLIQPISPENSIGRISRMDAINNKSVAEAAVRNKKSKLGKMKVALTQIDKEGFGTCSMCKNSIQAARLMYLPESTKCVRCAARS